ncbi:response regulator [Rhodoferax sp. AJA081-3]|uniref:response regulator n=1 Tax=Rhodoferax sp. AJA081-3 TaxID=2752316 RepID=UPI001AE021EE|nr:response regulator [Rhodoferax sp. AJA081-3]QTN29162.1 response regulator [Rhodoferax sp. AJA081-3]
MNILLADDDNVSRMALAEALGGLCRNAPLLVNDGQRALESLQKGYLADLVITDVRMPNLDGLGLLKALRADSRFAPLPVMLITAFSERDLVAQALQLGVQGFILKPVTPDALLRARNVVGRFHASLTEGMTATMHRLSILPDRYWTYVETLAAQGHTLQETAPLKTLLADTAGHSIADVRSALNACLGASKVLGARPLEKALLQLDALLVSAPQPGDPRLAFAVHTTRLHLHWLEVYLQFNRATATP